MFLARPWPAVYSNDLTDVGYDVSHDIDNFIDRVFSATTLVASTSVYVENLKLEDNGGFPLARSEHVDLDDSRGLAYLAIRFKPLGELLDSVVAAY